MVKILNHIEYESILSQYISKMNEFLPKGVAKDIAEVGEAIGAGVFRNCV